MGSKDNLYSRAPRLSWEINSRNLDIGTDYIRLDVT